MDRRPHLTDPQARIAAIALQRLIDDIEAANKAREVLEVCLAETTVREIQQLFATVGRAEGFNRHELGSAKRARDNLWAWLGIECEL